MADIERIADERLNKRYICMDCNARNPWGAEYCRKCRSTDLRRKIRDLQKNRS